MLDELWYTPSACTSEAAAASLSIIFDGVGRSDAAAASFQSRALRPRRRLLSRLPASAIGDPMLLVSPWITRSSDCRSYALGSRAELGGAASRRHLPALGVASRPPTGGTHGGRAARKTMGVLRDVAARPTAIRRAAAERRALRAARDRLLCTAIVAGAVLARGSPGCGCNDDRRSPRSVVRCSLATSEEYAAAAGAETRIRSPRGHGVNCTGARL